MLKKIISLSLVYVFLGLSFGYGQDWKRLHGEADKLSLQEAWEAAQKRPDSKEDRYILALVYLNLHKDKEAGGVFQELLNLDTNSIPAKWGVAEVLRRQHKIDESEELLNAVIKLDANFFPAYITLAYIKYRKSEFNEAVRLASRVVNAGPDEVDLTNYVRALLLVGGAKGMIAHYGGPLSKLINGTAVLPNLKKAKELQPDSAAVMFGLGSFYLLAPSLAGRNLTTAQGYLEKAVKVDPLFADAYVRLAQVYQIKGDGVKYEKFLAQALEIDPQNELALDISGGRCKFICAEKDR